MDFVNTFHKQFKRGILEGNFDIEDIRVELIDFPSQPNRMSLKRIRVLLSVEKKYCHHFYYIKEDDDWNVDSLKSTPQSITKKLKKLKEDPRLRLYFIVE